MEAWRYALASVVGTAHDGSNQPCQDAAICRVLSDASGAPVLLAVVADGAGSAQRSDIGAEVACDVVAEELESFIATGGGVRDISRELVCDWLERLRRDLEDRAQGDGLSSREYACTLVLAIIGAEYAVFCQVGDGAMVTGNLTDASYDVVFWPQEGEYANQTNFATEASACDCLDFRLVEASVDEVALFSDGLQRLALHYASRTAYVPFFKPLFETVRRAPTGDGHELSNALGAFLSSQAVIQRTDDDKTLILATRLSPEPPLASTEADEHARTD